MENEKLIEIKFRFVCFFIEVIQKLFVSFIVR